MKMFTLPGRKAVLGLAAAGMLFAGALGGTALANEGDTGTSLQSRYEQFTERLATLLGKQPTEVRDAITQVQHQYIDEALAAGKITAEQAAAMKERAAQGGAPFLHGPGRHGMPGAALMGEVVKVEGQTLTVKTPDGTEQTAQLTAATEIRQGRDGAADASALTAGAKVAVFGQADAQGVLTAERVHIHDGQPGERGPGHRGGPRGGRGPQGGQPPAAPTPSN